MPTQKIFTGSTVTVSSDWAKAVGCVGHHRQVNLVVLAWVKRDAAALLTDRGLGQGTADYAVREMRQVKPPQCGEDLDMLIDAGLVDTAIPGVYLWERAAKDAPVFRVEADGVLALIGHFRYDPVHGGRDLYVEPVGQDGDS